MTPNEPAGQPGVVPSIGHEELPVDGLRVDVLPVGDEGLLLEVTDLDAVLVLEAAVRAAVEGGDPAWREVTDVVPAARTVLLLTRDDADLRRPGCRRPWSAPTPCDLPAVSRPTRAPKPHPTRTRSRSWCATTGPDLDEVAAHTGLTRAEVVAAHTGTPWRVAFGGFAPGFAYLVGGDPRLHVPRRERPRPSVPAGSVGLAGEFSGVYPRSSPGGWQLLGTTDAVLWDAGREPPALLRPGTTVRFVDAAATP